MKDWQKYVGHQPIEKKDERLGVPASYIFYLTVRQSSDGNTKNEYGDMMPAGIRVVIEKAIIQGHEFMYDSETIGAAVEAALLTFPPATDTLNGDSNDQFCIQRTRTRIAKESKRGVGNQEIDTDTHKAVFYNGSNSYDSPLIVAEYDNKFALFKHPDFNKYGRVMEKI